MRDTIIAAGTVATTAATSIPWALGFTKAGVAAGSIAAGIQSSIGSVAAGSWFAGMQSVAATSVVGGPMPAVVAAVGGAAYVTVKYLSK